MRLAYYPGCTQKTTAKNFDTSTVAAASILDIDLIELPRWNCCGTVHALTKDDVMHYLAPIRNLVRVEEMNAEGSVEDRRVVTQCAMCYNTLRRANVDAKGDPDKMKKIIVNMEKEPEYRGSVDVVHFLEVIHQEGWDKVNDVVKKPLTGLRVVPYYGCLLLRPRGLGIDDPDNPQIMEGLLGAIGADVVDIPFKTKCCGAYHTVHMKEVAADLSQRILRQAVEAGADMVVTACPLCEFNLGSRQKEMRKLFMDIQSIPVVYYTQLMALSFGLGEEEVGFGLNDPDPRAVLKERGLI